MCVHVRGFAGRMINTCADHAIHAALCADGMSDDNGSDSNSDDDGPMDMEKQSRKLERKAREEQRMADAEMQTNIQESEKFVLPSGQEIQKINRDSEDLQVIQLRVRDCMTTLADFKNLRDPARTRKDYMALLKQDLAFT